MSNDLAMTSPATVAAGLGFEGTGVVTMVGEGVAVACAIVGPGGEGTAVAPPPETQAATTEVARRAVETIRAIARRACRVDISLPPHRCVGLRYRMWQP